MGTLGNVGPAGRPVCFIDDQREAISPGHAAEFDGQHRAKGHEPSSDLEAARFPDEGAPSEDDGLHSSPCAISISTSSAVES